MNAISNDDVRVVNWIKSARVGATKTMLAGSAYFAHHKKRNQLFYQPTDDAAEDFCKTELDTMLRDVACMGDIFPELGKKSPKNTIKLKQFVGSSLRVLGGEAAGNYRRYTSHVVFYDELESFKGDIQGEGNPLVLGDKRMEGALFPKSVRMTTPRLKNGSLIEPEVNNSDHLFKFHTPCPHCHQEQVLKWGGKDESYGFKWLNNNPTTCFYMCENPECSVKVIRNNDLTDMSKLGVWRDENTGVWIDDDDFFRDENGVYIITPRNVSFHIWTAYSPFTQWSEFVSEFITAHKAIKETGDITKFKTFVNTTLGETWEASNDKDKLSYMNLYNRREHYPLAGFTKRGLILLGGFDMQDDRVEGEITAIGLNGEKWLVDYFILRGNPAEPELWDRLEERVNKTYIREDGQELPLTRFCFDSGGHYTTEVYDFCKRIGIHRAIPTKGHSVYGEPLVPSTPRTLSSSGVYLTMIGTDTAKEVLYSRLRMVNDDFDKPKAGYYHFPIADWCDKTYFMQLCNEWKVPKKYRGKTILVYDAASRRNEPVDTAVGVLACLKISIDQYGLNLEDLTQLVEHPERTTTTQNSFLDAARRLRVS